MKTDWGTGISILQDIPIFEEYRLVEGSNNGETWERMFVIGFILAIGEYLCYPEDNTKPNGVADKNKIFTVKYVREIKLKERILISIDQIADKFEINPDDYEIRIAGYTKND